MWTSPCDIMCWHSRSHMMPLPGLWLTLLNLSTYMFHCPLPPPRLAPRLQQVWAPPDWMAPLCFHLSPSLPLLPHHRPNHPCQRWAFSSSVSASTHHVTISWLSCDVLTPLTGSRDLHMPYIYIYVCVYVYTCTVLYSMNGTSHDFHMTPAALSDVLSQMLKICESHHIRQEVPRPLQQLISLISRQTPQSRFQNERKSKGSRTRPSKASVCTCNLHEALFEALCEIHSSQKHLQSPTVLTE